MQRIAEMLQRAKNFYARRAKIILQPEILRPRGTTVPGHRLHFKIYIVYPQRIPHSAIECLAGT